MGFLLNLVGLTNRPLKDVFDMSVESLALIYLIVLASMIITPIFYVKKQFTDELIAEQITQLDYGIKYNKPINHLLVFLFDVGGFTCLFLLPRWLS